MNLRALVDASGVVVNVIVFDSEGQFEVPDGMTLVDPGPTRVDAGWTYVSGAFAAPIAHIDPPLPAPTLAGRLAELASGRYAHQIGGVMFQAASATSPSCAASDPTSTGMMTSSYVAATSGHWVDGTPWKMADGTFVPLTAVDMQAMALKVLGYISACYAHEAELSAALATDLATDITAGWPPNT